MWPWYIGLAMVASIAIMSVLRFRNLRNLKDKVVFQVFGDGHLLAQTTAAFGQPAQTLAADLANVKIVELVARNDASTSDLPLVVTWGDAALRE